MKKKLLALLLSGAMILTLTTPAAFAEEPEGECCGACGQVECVCPPEEAPCEVCGEIECVCEKAEELPEEEVPGAAAPEIPEEPTVCEICGEIECVCEKIEEPEVPEVPETSEEPTEEPKAEETAEEEMSLFERLMACETLEEFWAIADAGSMEELMALTDEENAQIEEKIAELEPEPLPAIVIEEEGETVVSEIIYPTVSFTEVAPLGDPVVGEAD